MEIVPLLVKQAHSEQDFLKSRTHGIVSTRIQLCLASCPIPIPFLTSVRAHLALCALRPHLADLCPGLPSRRSCCRLRLLHLLLALYSRLLLLAFLDRGLAGCGAGFGSLRAALLDHVEGSAHDAALLLDGTAGALLGDFLAREMSLSGCDSTDNAWVGTMIGVGDELILVVLLRMCFVYVGYRRWGMNIMNLEDATVWCQEDALTSEIPFLCCLRYNVVQAIRRGFLRWRKRDSVLPFWKRKILLSPRT